MKRRISWDGTEGVAVSTRFNNNRVTSTGKGGFCLGAGSGADQAGAPTHKNIDTGETENSKSKARMVEKHKTKVKMAARGVVDGA